MRQSGGTRHDDLRAACQRKRLQIAIDGPAGAGKSTVGRSLAATLGCPAVDTGLMYRAVTLRALRDGVPLSDANGLGRLAESTRFAVSSSADEQLLIDDAAPSPLLRSPEVDAAVSEVSAHPEVRRVLVRRLRELAAGGCIVMIGRDIGTVVLPDATVKLWLTASAGERARRRNRDRLFAGGQASAERELADLARRDRYDSSRQVAPAVPAADAVEISTDAARPEDVLEESLRIVRLALDSNGAVR